MRTTTTLLVLITITVGGPGTAGASPDRQAPAGDSINNPLGAGRLSDLVDIEDAAPDSTQWCDADSKADSPCQSLAQSAAASDVIPEPATMTLLATGLLGMAAATARRRRQERE